MSTVEVGYVYGALLRHPLPHENVVWLQPMDPAEIPQISHNELTDLEAIGEGGFGVAYRAKHARLGTVVYKKLNAVKLGDRYSASLF